MVFYNLARKRPETMKRLIKKGVEAELGPAYDIATHFTPRYNPWDQRICLVPNGDLFEALRKGDASIVTDQIETFTERGILLQSGRELEADLIVTATGLNLNVLGDVQLSVDGAPVEPHAKLTYKGMMLSDVPNLAQAIGYTNASWTLKCDLTSEYVCRLLNHMEATGLRQCAAHNSDPSVTPEPWINFSSGYVQRSLARFPRQGSKAPWKLFQNYARDLMALRFGKVDDGVMHFSNPGPVRRPTSNGTVLGTVKGWLSNARPEVR
jgi:cation diffusion facilitator CzcD-associated flavoprotein CzcO